MAQNLAEFLLANRTLDLDQIRAMALDILQILSMRSATASYSYFLTIHSFLVNVNSLTLSLAPDQLDISLSQLQLDGTLVQYLHPDVLWSKLREANDATDLWVAGCILWEMYTGKSPFAGGTLEDTIANITSRRIVNQLPANCDADARSFLEAFFGQKQHSIADALKAPFMLAHYQKLREQLKLTEEQEEIIAKESKNRKTKLMIGAEYGWMNVVKAYLNPRNFRPPANF